jgi:2-polyprenyl-3-methyl-5-hydroxy-6-metoxy-1,4-benzoquinol methylase
MNLKEEKQRAAMFQLKIYKAAGHLAKVQKVNSFLDLGCGYPTKLADHIYPITRNITGVDLKGKIDLIKNMGFGTWIVHDFDGVKILNLRKKFDMIISADVIEHLDNPNVLLNAIKKHSTRRTVILLSTPDAESTKSTPEGRPANQR